MVRKTDVYKQQKIEMKLEDFKEFKRTKIAESNARKDGDFYFWIEDKVDITKYFD